MHRWPGHALCLVLLAWAAAAQQRGHVRRAQECASFTPTVCLVGTDVRLENRHCRPHPCAFPEFFCPLVAGGYFSYRTGGEGGGCDDAFMSQAQHLPPPCGTRCCRADHAGNWSREAEEESPGESAEVGGGEGLGGGRGGSDGDIAPDFKPGMDALRRRGRSGDGGAAGLVRYSFEPTDSTCRYREIGRGQVMRFLATHNSSLLLLGDSTVRQLYLRLVAMMRGQPRQLDVHVHSHLQYQFCREVDFLRVAANSAAGRNSTVDPRFLKAIVPAFFRMEVGPGQADARRLLAECSRPPLQANYLQAPLWGAQMAMLPRYLAGLPEGHKPVVVVSVGYWQSGDTGALPVHLFPAVPPAYLEALSAVRDKVVRLFFVGMPISKGETEATRRVLASRNAALRAWAAKEGAPFAFVDFEALVAGAGAPKGTSGSKHYACWVAWRAVQFPQGAAGNPVGGGQMLGRVESVHATQDGQCSDEMNRNVWQVLLNALLDGTGARRMGDGEGR